MRSSPSFLAVSRSEGEASDNGDNRDSLPRKPVEGRLPRLTDESNSFEVRLKVGYKTVLLVVVLADLIHTSFQEVVGADTIQTFLENVGF
jgi:hypothetical protein